MRKGTESLLSFSLIVIMVLSLVLTGCGGGKAPVEDNGEAAEGDIVEEIDYPEGPITAICPWSPGGGSDIAFRGYMSYLEKELGVDIHVQNVSGGDGDIGLTQALAAEPDGYTLAMLQFDVLSNAPKGITDTTYKDFALINMFTLQDVILVTHTDYGWETFEDFRQAALEAKENGDTLKIGIAGFWLLAAGMMVEEAGLQDAITIVPFDGSGVQVADLLGKHIDAAATSSTAALSHIETGDFTILGTTGTERDPDYPDVPTFVEMGYDVVIAGLRAVGVHKDTDPAILEILRKAGKAAFDNPEFDEWATETKMYHVYMDHDETEKYLDDLAPKVEETMKELGLI